MKVGDEERQGIFTVTVGKFVEGEGVAFLPSPSFCADAIERFGELTHRFKQYVCLLWRWLKQYPNRSVHGATIPFKNTITQRKEGWRGTCLSLIVNTAIPRVG